MYYQNDETGILDVLEVLEVYFAAQSWWEKLLNKVLKILSVNFIIQWWHLCEFLGNKTSKKIVNFSFSHCQVFSKSSRGNRKL